LRSQIRRSINTGGRDVANAAVLNSLRFAWPTPAEQDRICNLNANIQNEMNSRGIMLAKLRLQKSGLMQDLLTGTVSAASLLESDIIAEVGA
jgi:type I restriction enzyme S subunit